MTVLHVNSQALTGAGTTGAITVTVPAGTHIQAGDLIIACCAGNGTHVANGMTVSDSVNSTNYTSLLEQQESSGSAYYQDTKYYQTPAAIPDGSTFTFTPFASYTAAGITLDVFRGCTGGIDKAAAGATASASTTIACPALGGNATAGALVISMAAGGGAFTLTQSTLTTGSVNTSQRSCGIAYLLSASGSSTYAVNWTQGSSGSWAGQTASFAACSSGPAFIQAVRPVRAQGSITLPPRGWVIRGRVPASQILASGPVFRQATQPIRAKIPVNPRAGGLVVSSQHTPPYVPPVPPAPPAAAPAAGASPLPSLITTFPGF